ncbi:MAG TPA: CbtB domain-containing protein [Stellaceae bacterium]|jgi:cobalt transporter subunit CbtB|nr:CbtB domain-containing protein [Stellaceae bacterium]
MISSVSHLRPAALSRTAALPALVAMALGLLFIYGVGFAHPTTIHNAAHDTRHSFAFPCH